MSEKASMNEPQGRETLDGQEFFGLFRAVCLGCKHKHRTVRPVCAAFPDGIPEEIWQGRNPHAEAFPGDHGIRYEPPQRTEVKAA